MLKEKTKEKRSEKIEMLRNVEAVRERERERA